MFKKVKGYNELVTTTAQSPQAKAAFEKMYSEVKQIPVVRNFIRLFSQVQSGQTGEIRETDITAVTSLPSYDDLPEVRDLGIMSKLAVLKFNGGLGTGMGLDKAKSLLEVKPGASFLDITSMQMIKTNTKLVLMNSFATQEDTTAALAKYGEALSYSDFQQFKHPKILKDTLMPATNTGFGTAEDEWNPSGHGDVYPAIALTGTLDKLLAAGNEYVFISNSDNLGAVADPKLLQYMIDNKIPFLMEVANRTPADTKGGHLVRDAASGQLRLRESAQVNGEDSQYAQDITLHKYFNTNNMWINLRALKNLIEKNNGVLPLPLIRNEKNLVPTDKTSPKVFQIETASGAAIELFEGAQAVVIPKKRFAPVKACSDLLALRSDVYILNEDSQMVINPKRTLAPIVIKLDDNYKFVKDFEARFPVIPSLVNVSDLEVKGDVVFGAGLTLSGSISVINNSKKQFTLENNNYENVIIEINENGEMKVLPKNTKQNA